MRRIVIIAWLLLPAWAIANPTLALAPIDGDKDGKVAELIGNAVDEDFKVIAPSKVEAAMGKAKIEEVDPRTIKKLRKKLDAEIVVYGSIEKEGKKRNLTLSISARNLLNHVNLAAPVGNLSSTLFGESISTAGGGFGPGGGASASANRRIDLSLRFTF